MKKIFHQISVFVLAIIGLSLSSCESYLNEESKGKRIPTTLEDYEAMLRYEYGLHRMGLTNALILLNDQFVSTSSQGNQPLQRANYNWEEETDRNL